ncbi:heat shock 70 kDa protein 12A-like [Mytilus californianus]|uniref:heat shock 70 kDa protein 12A-like n=1 Tax=Mytilus californianus TaxID=6549 RepID=UPI002245B93B|nr:heat shock 70 kDa protein 12A-like [Mytilus californianus]
MAVYVAAIDFGTTYSGYAFSVSSPNTELKNVEILSNQVWNSGTAEVASLKTPTCLLLTKERDLVAFGYEAEEQYADIVMDGHADDYYFFHRFKMNLHNNQNIRMSMVLEDVRGKPLPAIDVFSLSIQALKCHLHSSIEVKNIEFDKRQTKWVLTVPAIWTDTAKQFMRKSAEKAGIPRDNLTIALEPEAASIYCQTFPSPGCQEIAEIGSRYMVVDLGGGTVDITVHEKNANGTLKEVVKASGNGCGGTFIDDEFIQLFVRIFGRPIMNSLKSEFPDSYLYLLRSIENVKRVYETSQTRKVNITIPRSTLDDLCQSYLGENITTVINSSSLSSNIEIIRDKIRIEPVFVESLFKATCDNVVSLLQSVLQQSAVPNVTKILLVGGFADCKVIQNTMKSAFLNENIILQEDTSTIVLKGAVLFGYTSDYISSRMARYTYGIEIDCHFDDKVHAMEKIKVESGKRYCKNVFSPFMKINTPISVGHTIEKTYETREQFQRTCLYQVFYTKHENVMYTDTGECSLLGEFTIHFINPTKHTREMKVIFNFGDTEFSLTVIDVESKSEKKEFFELQR